MFVYRGAYHACQGNLRQAAACMLLKEWRGGGVSGMQVAAALPCTAHAAAAAARQSWHAVQAGVGPAGWTQGRSGQGTGQVRAPHSMQRRQRTLHRTSLAEFGSKADAEPR